MESNGISALSEVYSCSQSLIVRDYPIQAPEFQVASQEIYNFLWLLGERQGDDFWRHLVWSIKNFHFDMCAAPLGKGYFKELLSTLLALVRKKYQLCLTSYPDCHDPLIALGTSLRDLSESNMDHLLEKVWEICSEQGRGDVAILLKESRHIPLVTCEFAAFESLHECEVITTHSLRGAKCYDAIILAGKPQWFPDYVFSAPRARSIYIARYHWMGSGWKMPGPVFLVPFQTNRHERKFIEIKREEPNEIESDLLLPTIDLESIAENTRAQAQDRAEEEDYAEANLLLLEGNYAVFLESSSNALVIVPGERSERRVRKVRVNRLEPDMFVLLRTESGGDYIVPVANHIMREKADRLRERQMRWKDGLRAIVKSKGIDGVCSLLRQVGSERANYTNVRNWMSARNIRPRDQGDFDAILELVGLGDEIQEYWDSMKIINSAHLKAGRHIHKLLVQEAGEADLSDLQRLGTMEFDLGDKDAGSLTAFRILKILPETVEVEASQIGSPFETGGE